MARHLVTYTNTNTRNLDDDFSIFSIWAYTDKEAALIMHNIERFFNGTLIACEKQERQQRKKGENSDRRKR